MTLPQHSLRAPRRLLLWAGCPSYAIGVGGSDIIRIGGSWGPEQEAIGLRPTLCCNS